MKKYILSTLLCAFVFGYVFAQNSVSFSINHQLDGEVFAMESNTENNLDNAFYYTRLQYYISGISFVDNGGEETMLGDIYVLITAGNEDVTTVDLGMHDVDNIQTIKFHIGVDEARNHLDPALWLPAHPLAPKDPSMHWGWAGGYRFIALEGQCSPALNQNLEMHCIGNKNYTLVEIPVDESAIDGQLQINLNAAYTEALNNIDISQGLVQHGDLNDNVTLAANFGARVFTDANAPVGLFDAVIETPFTIYPNPSVTGHISIDLEVGSGAKSIELYDMQGKFTTKASITSNTTNLLIEKSGVYMAIIRNQDGVIMGSQKVIKL